MNNLTRTLPPDLCSGNNLHTLIALRNFLFLWLVRKQIKNVGKRGRVFGWQENNGKWQKWEKGLTEVEIGFLILFFAPLAIYEVEAELGFYWVGTLSWNFLLSWRILIGLIISHCRNGILLNCGWYDPLLTAAVRRFHWDCLLSGLCSIFHMDLKLHYFTFCWAQTRPILLSCH